LAAGRSERELGANLNNRRIYHYVIIRVVVVHQRSFNKIRDRMSEVIRGYVANCKWTVPFFWITPSRKFRIKSIEALSPIPEGT
jgi:hypothetical protein